MNDIYIQLKEYAAGNEDDSVSSVRSSFKGGEQFQDKIQAFLKREPMDGEYLNIKEILEK